MRNPVDTAMALVPMVVEQNGRAFLTDQRFVDPSRKQRGGAFVIPLDIPGPSS